MKPEVRSRLRGVASVLSRRLIPLMTDPFVRTPGLLLCMIVMQMAVPLYYYGFVKHLMDKSFASGVAVLISEALVMAWAMLAVYVLLRRWRRWASVAWLTPCIAALVLNWLIDYALLTIYRCSFTADIAAVIAVTDMEESAGFVASYTDTPMVVGLVACIAGFVASYFLGSVLGRYAARRWGAYRRLSRVAALSLLAVAWGWVVVAPGSLLNTTNMRSKFMVFCRLDLGRELTPACPDLVVDGHESPQKIVVILGESHCRSHSSLYGYGKRTQPRQEALVADSSLLVFAQVVSPDLTTMKSIQQLIGTWDGDPSRDWHGCLTFIEAAGIAGYSTRWISNQSFKGAYDNPVVKVAEFCDSYAFTNSGMYGVVSGRHDEAVLPLVSKYVDAGKRDLTVIHLMGSHLDYAARYPDSFARFKAGDYTDRPAHQRKVLADYDNSLLYNDYVVSEIYKLYADLDAVVVYLSDHAQDLYDSSPGFKGHAKSDDPVSRAAGQAVPFTVWLSPVFRAAHPGVVARMAAATSRPVALTDLIYSLMDLMGARFAGNDDVESRSFFRPLP